MLTYPIARQHHSSEVKSVRALSLRRTTHTTGFSTRRRLKSTTPSVPSPTITWAVFISRCVLPLRYCPGSDPVTVGICVDRHCRDGLQLDFSILDLRDRVYSHVLGWTRYGRDQLAAERRCDLDCTSRPRSSSHAADSSLALGYGDGCQHSRRCRTEAGVG